MRTTADPQTKEKKTMKDKYRKGQTEKYKGSPNLSGAQRLLMDITPSPLPEENLLEEPVREERIRAMIRKKQKKLGKNTKTMILEGDWSWGPGPSYRVSFWIQVKQKGDQTLIISSSEQEEQILKDARVVEIPQTGQVEFRKTGSRWNLSFRLVGIYKKSSMAFKILKNGNFFGHRSLEDGEVQMDKVPSGKYIFILIWKGAPLSCFGLEL